MEQVIELKLNELFQDIELFKKQKVSVEGIVDHVCPSKTKLALISDDGENSIEVVSDRELSKNYEAKRIVVKGTIKEIIVDEEFLQKKKQEIDKITDSELKNHALENYEKLRQKVATSSQPVKKYLLECEELYILGCE